jgi:hypothetical protein
VTVLRALLATAVCAVLSGVVSAAAAADGATTPPAAPRAAAASESATPWADLTRAQKQALAPLERDWSFIDGVRQRKWVELAGRLPSMPEAERARIQQRMAQWASLTPAKRNQVRLQFLEAQSLPAEQRQARWQEYQALGAEEKKALARQAPASPVNGSAAERLTTARSADKKEAQAPSGTPPGKQNVVQAPAPAVNRSGTATTLQAKPGATTRPLTTPASPPAHHQTGLPKIVATEGFVDPATLLPKRGPQGAAVRSALSNEAAPKP